ncbi:MAG: ABC transporter permease subunit [Alphaproteobacteria bacterium]|nr:ABC transporter permease subunit [Alphaproteobacteria bacterium]
MLRNSSPALMALAALPMLVILVLVSVLIWISFQTGILGTADAQYTFSNYLDVFDDSLFVESVLNTIVFSITATAVAMGIGLPIAWVTERTTLPGKSWIYVIMTLGLLIPGIYTAMGWTFLAHERIGFLNRWAMQYLGFSDAPLNIATPIGMGFVQGLSLAALGFILTAQMFRSMNPSLEEAAGIHGLGFFATLRRITLPLAMPAILAAVIYIVVIGIATFDIPAIIGLGSRVYLLSTFIYEKTNPGDEELAQHGITAALGVMMIVVAVLLTWWYSNVLRKGDQYGVVTGKGYRPTLVDIGRWKHVAWGFVFLYLIASKLIPLLLIAYSAFIPYMAPPSAKMFGLMTLEPFLEEIDWGLVLRGMKNTAILVLTVPAITLVLAFAISWLIVRSRSRSRYVLEFGAFLPHALPEVILAISALLLALFVLKGIVPLYGSVTLIAIVYVITRISFATRAINSALLQIHKELEEAAHTAGLSAVRTSWRILVPLLRPTLMAVWIWSAILVYRELTVAVFLVGHDNLTLPAVIWSYWQGGAINLAAGATLVMTALLTPLILLFWWFGRKSVMES